VHHAFLHIFFVDSDVIVSVRARLLVYKAQRVANLVYSGSKATTCTNTDFLFTSSLSYVRPAAIATEKAKVVSFLGALDETDASLVFNVLHGVFNVYL